MKTHVLKNIRAAALSFLCACLLLLMGSCVAFCLYAQRAPELTVSLPNRNFYPGDSFPLAAEVHSAEPVTWRSSDETVLTVDKNGTVTAVSPGVARIEATAGRNRASIAVCISTEDHMRISDAILDRSDAMLRIGNARHLLEDAPADMTWYSSRPEIAPVDENGWVYAKSPGSAMILGSREDSICLFGITVTEGNQPGSFYSTREEMAARPGTTVQAAIYGNEGTPTQWFSSDEAIATVEDGIVTVLHSGTCEITAKTADTAYTVPLTVSYSVANLLDSQEIAGKYAFLYDLTDGELLYHHGALDQSLYPASLTKLFTGYVALQYLTEDMVIVPGYELYLCPYDSSLAGLKRGAAITLTDLMAGLMICSGNDAANTMAATVGRILADNPNLLAETAIDIFMDEVNRQADELGLTGTHFVTPDGYHDPNHYTTLEDLIVMSQLAYNTPLLLWTGGQQRYPITMGDGTRYIWENHIAMMLPEDPLYCPYIYGMKTGTTTPAGRCLISSAEYEGKVYLIGTLGCREENQRNNDILLLLEEYVFSPED